MLRSVHKPCPHAAPHRIQTQQSSRYTTQHRKLSILQISTHIRKKFALLLMTYKQIDFRGIILDSFQRGGPLKQCQTIYF